MMNLRASTLILFLAASVTGASCFPANAETGQCRNEKGKFTKCVPPVKSTQCRNDKGKFIKCPAPETKTQK